MSTTLRYLGHSSFKLSSNTYSIVFDPYKDFSVPNLKFPRPINANEVLISHEHDDHNARDYVTIIPKERDMQIETIDCFHDDQQGALRGKNKIHIVKTGTITIVHLGDLGHQLNEEDIEKIKGCDVLLAPINGHFTLGAEDIYQLYQKVNPKIIIPMHYFKKEDNSGYNDDHEIDKFLSHFDSYTTLDTDFFVIEDYLDKTNCIIFK